MKTLDARWVKILFYIATVEVVGAAAFLAWAFATTMSSPHSMHRLFPASIIVVMSLGSWLYSRLMLRRLRNSGLMANYLLTIPAWYILGTGVLGIYFVVHLIH